MTDRKALHAACLRSEKEAEEFLDRLVRFESVSGHEGPAMEWLYGQFSGLADVCEKVSVPESIIHDPEYSSKVDKQPYDGRPNVRVALEGDCSGRSVIFNAHADVVPPTMKQPRPFDPFVKDGIMYGRGTCDDKGQIAVLWVMLRALKELGVRPKGDVILHLVIEEEAGGNGTLALVRSGERADCCIDLEPLSNTICTSIRGSVWFEGVCHGRAGHSGSARTTVSALKMAMEAIGIIEGYHDDLLARTIHDNPLFTVFDNPMPVNFGELHAGNWPTIAPEQAVFSGIFGFLTTPREEVMRELTERIRTRGPEWLRDNFEMTFPYRHDTSRIDPDLPFVKVLAACYKAAGVQTRVTAAPTSMDAWLYNNLLGVPTLATGCGRFEDAHTIHEHVLFRDVVATASALAMFVCEWCGIRE